MSFCKQRGIRLSGPPLGRPSTDDSLQAQLKQQAREDERIRVEVEGKFGQGKRRFGLGRVMGKLAETAETMIAITFLVMNLERRLRRLLFSLLFNLGRALHRRLRLAWDKHTQGSNRLIYECSGAWSLS